MMDGLLAPDAVAVLQPGAASPAVAVLVAEDAPTRMILCAGGGSFEASYVTLTEGLYLGTGEHVTHELSRRLGEVADRSVETTPDNAFRQGDVELRKAKAAGALADAGVGHA
jgi:hypothetical protein